MRRLSGWDHGAILITAVQLAAAIHVWFNGIEGAIPMHFNVEGEVDRWGDRREAALIVLVCGIATLLAHLAVNWAEGRSRLPKSSQAAMAMGRLVGLITPLSVSALIGGVALGLYWGDPTNVFRTIMALAWVLIAVVGAMCGKVGPNRWAGLRMSWTFKSRLAWEKSNRLLGRIYFFGAVGGLFAIPFLSNRWIIHSFLLVVLGGAIASSFQAWRTWKNDPEKLP